MMKLKKMKLALLGLVVAGLSSTAFAANNPASTAYVDAKIAELAARTKPLTHDDWHKVCPDTPNLTTCIPSFEQHRVDIERILVITGIREASGISTEVPLKTGEVTITPMRYPIGEPDGVTEFGPRAFKVDPLTSVSCGLYSYPGLLIPPRGYVQENGNNNNIFTLSGLEPEEKLYATNKTLRENPATLIQDVVSFSVPEMIYALCIGRLKDTNKAIIVDPSMRFFWDSEIK